VKAKRAFPHVYIILILLILLACLMTYIIPAGRFARELDVASGQTLVIAGSFEYTESTPVPPWLIPIKFFETLTSRSIAQIIFFIVILNGAFELITKALSIESLSRNIAKAFKKNSFLSISALIIMFSVAGFTMGMSTEAVMFLPITIAVVSAMGYDKVIAMSLIFVGTNIGFTAGIFNPFSIGIAQSIAELPLYSGMWIRWLVWFALLIPGCIYTYRYANKTKVSNGIVLDEVEIEEALPKIKAEQIITLCILTAAIVVTAYGVMRYGWFLSEMAIVFLLAGIASAFVGRFGINESCDLFTSGAKKMMGGVFIIGLAATIRTILNEGNIIDTIANGFIGQAASLPGWLHLPGLMWGNAIFNLLITSASGKAVIVMPIMVPMADVLDFSRQAAVLAFQLGDGVTNLTSPLSTTLNVAIATSGLTFRKWIRFYYPLVGIYLIVATIIMLFAGIVGY
jgi:uncharacterized ion transporter superfamily protein YfcC